MAKAYLYGEVDLSSDLDGSTILGPWPIRPQSECFIHNCHQEAECLEISEETGLIYPYCNKHIPVPSKRTISFEELKLKKTLEDLAGVREKNAEDK